MHSMIAFSSSLLIPARTKFGTVTCSVRKNRPCIASRLPPPTSTPSNTAENPAAIAESAQPPLPPESFTALASSFGVFLFGGLLPLYLSLSSHIPITDFTTHYVMYLLLLGFGTLHSGLASLRPLAVKFIGERLYRVLFAFLSLPSAGLTITYFIAHRYDGTQLWSLQGVPFVHQVVWALTFVSFLLLYPATFDLPQVAAIKRPRLTIFENGVTRISRHPQLWGQVLWCVAHTAWLGTSFSVVASCGLVAHHLFGVWNGDRRLRDQFGEVWLEYSKRTSILPFVAIADGRQQFKLGEFITPAYLGVTTFIIAAYLSHPLILRTVGALHW